MTELVYFVKVSSRVSPRREVQADCSKNSGSNAQVQTQQTNSLGSLFAFRNEMTFETDSDFLSIGVDLGRSKETGTTIDW